MIRIVTVPLDLTAEADRAITPGVVLARQLGASLELVVVSSPGIDAGADTYELQARAAQLVGVTASTVVLSDDDALTGLTPLAADPERLVCMASHGRGRLGELLVPNLAQGLVHAARRPVVVIGPHQDWWPGPVGELYLGIDERGAPTATLEVIDELAHALGADVGLVNTTTPEGSDEHPSADALGVEDTRSWLEARGHRVTVRHLMGEPAVTLADTADRASRRSPLVAVTARVSRRRDRVLHGSVTSRLISVNPVPTLVVPVTVSAEPASAADVVTLGS